MRIQTIAFASGLLFAFGLGLGGMTLPENVIGFLDFTGSWNPALMFVMGGALTVYALAHRLILKRKAPFFARSFSLPARRELDWRLFAGASVFGIGWGLGGYCPGPAVTSLASGAVPPLVFVASMLGGMWLVMRAEDARQPQATHSPTSERQRSAA